MNKTDEQKQLKYKIEIFLYLAVVPSEKDPLCVNCLYNSPPGANSKIM